MKISRRSLLAGAVVAPLAPRLGVAAPPGAVSPPALQYPLNRPINLLEYGNSFTTRGVTVGPNPVYTSIDGLSPMLEAMSGGALRMPNVVTNQLGFNGTTSSYLATNYAANVAANYSLFDWLVLFCPCVNDFSNNISAATSLANVQAVCNAAIAAGKVVLLTNPYFMRSGSYAFTTTNGETAGQANDLIANWARKTNGVVFIDFWNDIVNASSTAGTANANMQDGDGLHPASLAVQTIVERALATLGPLVPRPPRPVLGQIDFYDATNNPGGNVFSTLGSGATLLEGTAGSVGSGCSGQLPTYWTGSRNAGSDTIVFAKVAGTSGYGSVGGDQFTVGVSGAASADTAGMNVYPFASGLVGQQVEFLITMTTGATVAGLGDIAVEMLPNYSFTGGAVWGERADLLSSPFWLPNQSYLIRTPPVTVPAGTSAIQCQITLNFLSGATVSVTFSNPVLRKVLQ